MVIAVDFDGTLVCDEFPSIGEKREETFLAVTKAVLLGHKIILWTCRTGELLDEAVAYCAENGLVFDAINDNLPEHKEEWGNNCRKVYADVYLDDKAAHESVFPQFLWETMLSEHDNVKEVLEKLAPDSGC